MTPSPDLGLSVCRVETTDLRVLDRAGRPIRAYTTPSKPPANKGKRYEPKPPAASEILRAVETLGDSAQDRRLAALVAVLWRGGLGLTEALALDRADCDPLAGVIRVRGVRKAASRKAAMDAWGFERLARWQEVRDDLPAGRLFCVLRGPTAGQDWTSTGARAEVTRLGRAAGIKRFAPQQLRYAHAAELLAQGVPLAEAYRQLGLSLARNNRAPAILGLANGRHSSEALKPPGAEKILRSSRGVPQGEAYSLVRRAAQAADDAYRQARTRPSKRAWNEALRALHEAEEKIMLATVEDRGNE